MNDKKFKMTTEEKKEEIYKKLIDNCRNQSQKHGFLFECMITTIVFCLDYEENRTDKYDIPCEKNKFDSNENVSIKTFKNNNLDCADILRFFNYDFDKKNTIILIKYKQCGNKKIIEKIIEVDYNKKMHEKLFGDITQKKLEKYINYIKSIPRGKVPSDISNEYKKEKIRLQLEYNMYINISPKVDSKNQRRVQCSIPKIFDFLEKNREFIISESNDCVIRGKEIPREIVSNPRVRNKKSE